MRNIEPKALRRVVVVGPFGRMGRRVLDALDAHQALTLVGVLVRDVTQVDPKQMEAIGEGVVLGDDAKELVDIADVLIDFTAPPNAHRLGALCAERSVAYVVASTALTEEDRQALQSAAQTTAVLVAANCSVGVSVLRELVEFAAKRLDGFDVEIFEAHHRDKRDAPSGTALALGESVQAGRGPMTEVLTRAATTTSREPNDLGYGVIRGGSVSGDHTVFFFGDGERLELTHRAVTPDIFARGAIRAAAWLVEQRPGLYDMRDVFI